MSDPLRPSYSGGPIRDLALLCKVIGVSEDELHRITRNIQDHYRPISLPKPDGTERICWNPSKTLRRIQGRLVAQFLRKVKYPEHLHGSLPGRSYISNAACHIDSRWCVSLDVKNFFPSISIELVRGDIWSGFFGCPPDVAQALADLTTLNRQVPQGSLTASYLANLCLWKREGNVVRKLRNHGLRYTRYVDDIAISAVSYPTQGIKTDSITSVHSMLKQSGLNLKRGKTTVMTVGNGISVVGLSVGKSVGRSKKQREEISRTVIDYLGIAAALSSEEALKMEASLRGRIRELGKYHPRESERLMKYLDAVAEEF